MCECPPAKRLGSQERVRLPNSQYDPYQLFEAVRRLSASHRGEIEFTHGVRALIDRGSDVRWLALDGFWSDVGTPDALAELQVDPAVAALFGRPDG